MQIRLLFFVFSLQVSAIDRIFETMVGTVIIFKRTEPGLHVHFQSTNSQEPLRPYACQFRLAVPLVAARS
uniref:Secreted protein n=1 Tax=Trichuris muris TaxID=70415 RepID=A0A5S6QTG5_TRIMR